MAFRPIQPSPFQPGAGGSGSQVPERSFLLPKYDTTVQACENCRKAKSKCDGKRPKCGTCIRKERPCGYVGESGQSLIRATKSRLESLEHLFSSLQKSSPDEADRILQHIRMGGSLTEFNAEAFKDASANPQQPDMNAQSTGCPPGFPPTRNLPPPRDVFPGLRSMQNRSANANPMPILTPMTGQSARPIRSQLPEASLTAQALESFFSCSGRLFHVFTKDHILNYFCDVFGAETPPCESLWAKAGCVMAIASVGAQYLPDEFTKEVEIRFYSFAKQLFEHVLEQQPIDAVKVSTLLAQYNVLDKSMVALAYVEIGLSISRMYGLSQEAVRPISISESESADLQKTWRTLIFFSSWLSSTLGYISANDAMSNRSLLAEIRPSGPSDITEVVQIEMVKICILKADILRMQVAFKELTVPAMQSIAKDLQTWYLELPPSMRVETSGNPGLSVETKRSIFHVHLLYLGAIMLLYRRMASQFMHSYLNRPGENSLPIPLQGLVAEQGIESVLAASTSARILKLLLEDNSIFKRCWLVIFQAYTSGTVLLHAVIQKQMHNFHPATWQEDLEQSKDCIAVLDFCGSLDRVAAKFKERLETIYGKLSQWQPNPESFWNCSVVSATDTISRANTGLATYMNNEYPLLPTEGSYLLRIPQNTSKHFVDISLGVLNLLSQPFGEPDKSSESSNIQIWLRDPMRYEYPQMIERLETNYENSISF